MEVYSSGEDLIIKTRKPYTITKQRERWTEEEHNKFLDALKMHGRAWQRIEEHIGTKTAVQIRSHAQKFFSKLEREALNKGISVGKAHDIDIPPPRPKKKPSNPYPRKSGVAAAPSTSPTAPNNKSCSQNCNNLVLNVENDTPIQEPAETETSQRTKENLEERNPPEVFTLFHDAPCASISSASKSAMSKPLSLAPTNPVAFREFMPTKKEINGQSQIDEASAAAETNGNSTTDTDCAELKISRPQGFNSENQGLNSSPEAAPLGITAELRWKEKPDLVSKELQAQASQSYPRHVTVQVLGGNTAKSTPELANSASMVHTNPFASPTVSSATEHHTNSAGSAVYLPPFLFFNHFLSNPDTCKLQTPTTAHDIPSTLASFIVSNLLQNPAAHAAAIWAASFLPSMDIENSINSAAEIPGGGGGIPLAYVNPSPSMAAIAAATVAAATAWWTFHGLLPLCPHPSFALAPTLSTTTIPVTETFPVPVSENTEERKDQQPLQPEFSGSLKTRREAPVCPPLSSSDLDGSGDTVPDGSKLETEQEKPVASTDLHDKDKAKPRKQMYRSSCGSNTPSGSEVETDVVLEKLGEEGKEVSNKAGELSELNSRRCRNAGNVNDSWKEVSEEGRMAFQALFSREVLPQSFSPPQVQRNKVQPKCSTEEEEQKLSKDEGGSVRLDLSITCPIDRIPEKDEDELPGHCLRSNLDKKELLVPGHVKLKGRRAGFEPYKRCFVEANRSRVVECSESEEKGAKRIRLEEAAST